MIIRLQLCGHASITRSALRQLLATVDDIEVVAESDVDDVVAAARSARPDVVLLEAEQVDGVETTVSRIHRALHHPAAVVVLSGRAPIDAAVGLFRVGVRGFLLKDDKVEDLLHGVRAVASGGAVITPSMLADLVDRLSVVPVDSAEQLDALTRRELEVLHMVSNGLSNAEIARSLQVEETTVKSHVSRMLGKLGMHNRVQAAAFAYRSSSAASNTPGPGNDS